VRNLERWLTQVDVPGGVAKRSHADVHRHELTRENGIADEGLSTDVAHGQSGLYLRLDPTFRRSLTGDVLVRVTWLDRGVAQWELRSSAAPVEVTGTGSGHWVTSTVRLAATALDGGLAGQTDLALTVAGDHDLQVRFVRVVRLDPPTQQ